MDQPVTDNPSPSRGGAGVGAVVLACDSPHPGSLRSPTLPVAGEGRRIVRLGVVDSTQRVAFELAESGAADGTVVMADTQTAGRGRRGRVWHDAPGESLLVSIVVRPRLNVADLPKLSLAAGVAVAEALGTTTGLDTRLKWPNDVLVNGRKLAGILLESRMAAEPIVVAGIGVNLRQRTFSPELAETATSVDLEGGRAVGSEELLEALLDLFDRWKTCLESEGFAPLRSRWLSLADTIGRAVTVGEHAGVAVDLAEDGALVLRQEGSLRRVVAGEVAASHPVDTPGAGAYTALNLVDEADSDPYIERSRRGQGLRGGAVLEGKGAGDGDVGRARA